MLILLIIFIIILLIVEQISLQYGLQKIHYELQVSRPLLEPDEEFTITSTVENHKFWFVPYISMTELFPVGIIVPGQEDDLSDSGISENLYSSDSMTSLQQNIGTWMHCSFYLMPNQQYVRKVTAKMPRRGRYLFTGAMMNGGDLLGLKDGNARFPATQELVVIPKALPCPDLGIALGGFLGDMSVNRFLFEDPMLTIGFSEYSGREPMRDISWTQSARMGRMMVKNYDHTVDLSVTVLLNIQSVKNVFENEETVEQCISMTRSVCEILEEKQIKYSFITNSVMAGSMNFFSSIEEGLGNRHFYSVMESLGRATMLSCESFSSTILRACRSGEQGRYHIIITPDENDAWSSALQKLRDLSDGKVFVLTPSMVKQDDSKKEGVA